MIPDREEALRLARHTDDPRFIVGPVTGRILARALLALAADLETAERDLATAREALSDLRLVVMRQLTPLDVAGTHIDILRRNSESYDAQGRDNVALIVEDSVNEARKALFDALRSLEEKK